MSTTDTHDSGCRTALTESVPHLRVAVLLERIDVLANGPREANIRNQPCSQHVSALYSTVGYDLALHMEMRLQCRVLRKHADSRAQLFEPELCDVDAVDTNRSRVQLNDSEQQVLRR